MKFNSLVLISLVTLAVSQETNIVFAKQGEIVVKKQLDSRGLGLKDFISDHLPWSGKKHWKDHDGKEHWNDKDGKEHWRDHDGKDCWNDKDGNKHWKDQDGKEHWNDKDGKEHWRDNDSKVYKPPVAMKRSDIKILH